MTSPPTSGGPDGRPPLRAVLLVGRVDPTSADGLALAARVVHDDGAHPIPIPTGLATAAPAVRSAAASLGAAAIARAVSTALAALPVHAACVLGPLTPALRRALRRALPQELPLVLLEDRPTGRAAADWSALARRARFVMVRAPDDDPARSATEHADALSHELGTTVGVAHADGDCWATPDGTRTWTPPSSTSPPSRTAIAAQLASRLARGHRRRALDGALSRAEDLVEQASDGLLLPVGAPPARPSLLRVMPEYASTGLWAAGEVGPFRHQGIDGVELGLRADLIDRLDAWIDGYERLARKPADAHLRALDDEGRAIARAVASALGPAVRVVYAAEADPGVDEPIPP